MSGRAPFIFLLPFFFFRISLAFCSTVKAPVVNLTLELGHKPALFYLKYFSSDLKSALTGTLALLHFILAMLK